jgi:hypothetical protein
LLNTTTINQKNYTPAGDYWFAPQKVEVQKAWALQQITVSNPLPVCSFVA